MSGQRWTQRRTAASWLATLVCMAVAASTARSQAGSAPLTRVTTPAELQGAVQDGAENIVVGEHMTLDASEMQAMVPGGFDKNGEYYATMLAVSVATHSITGDCTQPTGQYAALVNEWKEGQCVLEFVDVSGMSVQRSGSAFWGHNLVLALSGGDADVRYRAALNVQTGPIYVTDVSIVPGADYVAMKFDWVLQVVGPALLAGVRVRGFGPTVTEAVRFYRRRPNALVDCTFIDNRVEDKECPIAENNRVCAATTLYTRDMLLVQQCSFVNNTGMGLTRDTTVRKDLYADVEVYSDSKLLVRGVDGSPQTSAPLEAAGDVNFPSLSDADLSAVVGPVRAAWSGPLYSTVGLPSAAPGNVVDIPPGPVEPAPDPAAAPDAPAVPPADGTPTPVPGPQTPAAPPNSGSPVPAPTDGAPAPGAPASPDASADAPSPAESGAPFLTPQRAADASPSSGGDTNLTGIIVGALAGCAAIAVLVVLFLVLRRRRSAREEHDTGKYSSTRPPSSRPAVVPTKTSDLLDSDYHVSDDASSRVLGEPARAFESQGGRSAADESVGMRNLELASHGTSPFSSYPGASFPAQYVPRRGAAAASPAGTDAAGPSRARQLNAYGAMDTRWSDSTHEYPVYCPESRTETLMVSDARSDGGSDVFDLRARDPHGNVHAMQLPYSRFDGSVEDLEDVLDDMHARRQALLDRWQILNAAQRRVGGQGIVQFTVDSVTQQKCAVKFFTDRNALHREAELYQQPEIREMMAAVVQVEAEEESVVSGQYLLPPFIVLEKGESLDEWALIKSPDYPTSLQVLVQVVDRLRALHAAGLVHRDLKPANILWRSSVKEWTLIDFGCSVPEGTTTALSCSLPYAAPEIAQALKSGRTTVRADTATDIWSIGLVGYELLTGARAFTPSQTPQQIIAALTGPDQLPWERTSSKRMQKLGIVKRLIRLCLSRDPEERPCAEDLLRSLNHTLLAASTRHTRFFDIDE